MSFLKNLSVERRGLKYKMLVAFALMSVIPLLVMTYFVSTYLINNTENTFQVVSIVMFALWIAWAGYVLSKKIIIPVIDLALETKIIASGHYDSKIKIREDNELGDIAKAVNTMTEKMKGYIGELQDYSKKTSSLNIKIHRKVLTLTNLMRLGDLISSGAAFREVTNFATEKMASELYGGFCAIFIKEKVGGYALEAVFNNSGRDVITSNIIGELFFIESFFQKDEFITIDASLSKKPWQKEVKKKLQGMNAILFPLKIDADIVGIVMFGNFGKEVEFTEEDAEVLRAFANEIVLAYQSSLVFKKVKTLEVVDGLTGLYTFGYLEGRLEDEISRAIYYQRPCSLIVVNIDDFQKYSNYYGEDKAKQVLKQVGKLLGGMMPPVGKVARTEQDEFGILLPELNKREALEIAKDVRKKIENMKISSVSTDKITVSVGVSENPIDGSNAKELVSKARQYVEKVKREGKNCVAGE
ncbi:MAG: diguanylate cyclase [Candidatus Omnitrophota bacterium]